MSIKELDTAGMFSELGALPKSGEVIDYVSTKPVQGRCYRHVVVVKDTKGSLSGGMRFLAALACVCLFPMLLFRKGQDLFQSVEEGRWVKTKVMWNKEATPLQHRVSDVASPTVAVVPAADDDFDFPLGEVDVRYDMLTLAQRNSAPLPERIAILQELLRDKKTFRGSDNYVEYKPEHRNSHFEEPLIDACLKGAEDQSLPPEARLSYLTTVESILAIDPDYQKKFSSKVQKLKKPLLKSVPNAPPKAELLPPPSTVLMAALKRQIPQLERSTDVVDFIEDCSLTQDQKRECYAAVIDHLEKTVPDPTKVDEQNVWDTARNKNLLGLLHRKLGNGPKAEEAFTSVIALNSRPQLDGTVAYQVSAAFYRRGQLSMEGLRPRDNRGLELDEAISDFESAVKASLIDSLVVNLSLEEARAKKAKWDAEKPSQ